MVDRAPDLFGSGKGLGVGALRGLLARVPDSYSIQPASKSKLSIYDETGKLRGSIVVDPPSLTWDA